MCPSLPPRNIKGARNKLEKEHLPMAIFLRGIPWSSSRMLPGFVPRIKESRSCLPPKKGSFPVLRDGFFRDTLTLELVVL